MICPVDNGKSERAAFSLSGNRRHGKSAVFREKHLHLGRTLGGVDLGPLHLKMVRHSVLLGPTFQSGSVTLMKKARSMHAKYSDDLRGNKLPVCL